MLLFKTDITQVEWKALFSASGAVLNRHTLVQLLNNLITFILDIIVTSSILYKYFMYMIIIHQTSPHIVWIRKSKDYV